eukprot:3632896-Pleurochrysis_carterae.AAC.1
MYVGQVPQDQPLAPPDAQLTAADRELMKTSPLTQNVYLISLFAPHSENFPATRTPGSATQALRLAASKVLTARAHSYCLPQPASSPACAASSLACAASSPACAARSPGRNSVQTKAIFMVKWSVVTPIAGFCDFTHHNTVTY